MHHHTSHSHVTHHTQHAVFTPLAHNHSLICFRCSLPPPAKYGGRHTVTLIPGDGIGPELLNHVKELFRFSCVPVDFEVVNVSSATEDDINNAITAIRRNGVALKGRRNCRIHGKGLEALTLAI
uniref:Isocitrate dehydrogenase (NAD(+)) 3 non-catalytic subunit gamma n=1 Tax=Hucho hucho TaxID=62062 RepID=A0A4W5KWW6_9TELE